METTATTVVPEVVPSAPNEPTPPATPSEQTIPSNGTNGRLAALEELRERHGFRAPNNDPKQRASRISRELLAKDGGFVTVLDDGSEVRVEMADSWPKHAPVFDLATERLAAFGFTWKRCFNVSDCNGKLRDIVRFTNWPERNGQALTVVELLTMELEDIDGAEQAFAVADLAGKVGKPAGFEKARACMADLHIGYKAIHGVSWLPGIRPFELPTHLEQELVDLGTAIFLLSDAVTALYDQDPLLRELLTYKVPGRIPFLMDEQPMELVRPDLAIFRGDEDGELHLVATELETAPAGKGMAHTMELGYSLEPTMLNRVVEYLVGRPYLVYMTSHWSEYLWEIAVFVQALRDRGVDARVLFNEPLAAVHERVNTPFDPKREAQKKPQLGWANARDDMPTWVRAAWADNKDLLGRLERYGFREFVGGCRPEDMPRGVGNTVVNRFGYFDNLGRASIEVLRRWRKAGATIQNGLGFAFESKVMMVAAHVPAVRAWIQERNETALAVLDVHLAETRLLHPRHITLSALKGEDPRKEECRPLWLTKFPGYDGNEQSWGARSVEFGAGKTLTAWVAQIDERMGLPHPVVAQHAIRQERFSVPFVDWDGTLRIKTQQRPRYTPFLLRGPDGVAVHGGGTMTFRKDRKVHGATDAIEAPVVFA
jgi:hypothetical protein